MFVRRLAFPVLLAMCFAGHAAAQDGESIPFFSLDDARKAITSALRSFPQAACGNERCSPATPEEFKNPPIGPEEARSVLVTGAKSARLKWCGLNWEDRTFSRMLLHFQASGIYETRTIALIGAIHDSQFHKDYLGLQALRTCTPELRDALDRGNPEIQIDPWQRIANNALLDHSVSDMLGRILQEIHNSRCGDSLCAPATEEEKANPPLTITQARQAMRVGLFSGAAQFCSLDWRGTIFLPFMAHSRRTLNMSARQLVIVNMLHSTMQRFILDKYRTHEKVCSDTLRQSLENDLSPG